MKIREIYCKRWFLSDDYEAITLYPFIFYNGVPKLTLRKHEWVHVDQIRREGWFKYYTKYLWYAVTKGYDNNPYEIEAYKNQRKARKEFI